MDLRQALRLDRSVRLALVGAGGKTTALFQLAREFEPPVVVTASTHLGEWQAGFADRHLIVTRPEDVLNVTGQIEGVTLFTGPLVENRRLQGLDADTLRALRSEADRFDFPLLLEADGSKQRPLKAPAEHEPNIPVWVNTVVVVAGLAGLGQPLDEATVHRPELFARLSDLSLGDTITPQALAEVLTSVDGGFKNIPPGARAIVLLNQADTPDLVEDAQLVANRILIPFDTVAVSALELKKIFTVANRAAGIVLAGGGAKRMGGKPKLLLPWREKPLVRHVAESALAAGLWPVVLVVGADGESVRAGVEGLPVTCVNNSDWQAGQSTSVRRGIGALPENIGLALFFVGDQPMLKPDLVRALIETHRRTQALIIAPRVAGQRTNPVLFDRALFPELMKLEGDTGGRALFDRYPVTFVDWDDPNLLLDVDTPEDYKRLLGM